MVTNISNRVHLTNRAGIWSGEYKCSFTKCPAKFKVRAYYNELDQVELLIDNKGSEPNHKNKIEPFKKSITGQARLDIGDQVLAAGVSSVLYDNICSGNIQNTSNYIVFLD